MFKLRPYQQHLVDENRRLWSEGVKNPCTVLPTGGGKCHRKGTKILMFDGTIKNVEDVAVGDKLMGPDSTPRNVLALGRGSEMMYEVAQVGADNYFVNESHILSLRYPHLGKVENVSVLEYLEISEIFGDVLHGWRVPNILTGDTSFVTTPITSVKPVGIEPYYGFEIDGDHLYLLGDFTVTHNTVVAAELIRQEQAAGGYFAAIAHRQELVGQISLALARQGVLHNIVAPRPVVKFCSNLHSEELGRSFYSPTAPGFVGGVNTVIRRDMSKIKDTVSLVFQDECFPAGTLVRAPSGDVPIETLEVGDPVMAFDEASGKFKQRVVDRLFKNPITEELVRVEIQPHHVLICTKGHPFYTKRGWVQAGNLSENDEVLYDGMEMYSLRFDDDKNHRESAVPLEESGANLLHERMREGVQSYSPQKTATKAEAGGKMSHVRKHGGSFETPIDAIQENWTSVLFDRLFECVPCYEIESNNGENQSEIRIRTNESEQSHVSTGMSRENAKHSDQYGPRSENTRGQRTPTNGCGNETPDDVWASWFHSSNNRIDWSIQKRGEMSETLQSGLRERDVEDSDRSGRVFSYVALSSRTGQPERLRFNWTRLESVSILERSDSERIGDGFTYNIEVSGLHTYVANGVVVHNCHHVLADNLWGKAASLFPRANGLYVTATPLRADGKGLGRHADGIFDEFIFGPPMRQLIREGSLTDYRIYAPPSDIDLTAMKFGSDGDYSRPELVKRAKKSGIVGDVVSNYEKYCQGVQTVVFVVDVEQAHEVANKLNDCGVSAVALSANNTDSERQQAINAFKRKEIQVIVNVDLLGEGFDCPAIECVIMARPTMSYGLYCLSEDTEVLTPQGWVGISDAESTEEVYGFDMQDSSVSVQPITGHVVRDKYDDEDMYGIKGPHLDILVSDKHDMVVKSKPRTGLMRKQKAEDVAQRKSMFNIPVSGVGEFKGADLSDSDLEFLGWFLSDGHLNKHNNAVAISQSVVKQRHCESIEKAIRGCGFKFGKHLAKRKDCPDTHNDLYIYSVSKGEPRGRDKHLTGWSRLEKWLDKSIPPCYDDLTVDQFEKLLRTFNLGDGLNNHGSLDYVKRTLTVTAGDNKTMADRLQHMCIVRGYRCNMAVLSTEGKKDLYLLHIRKSMFSSVAGRNDRDGSISGKKPYKRSRFEVKRYEGSKVWCLSNPLGTLITRRNGKVAIVGNCQQFGRGIRLLPGKQYGLIIDMVGNVKRHGLPDAPREWSLDRREKRSGGNSGDLTTKTCSDCLAVYAVGPSRCPFCGGNAPAPGASGRGDLVVVDADLRELSPEELAELRGEADKLDREWTVPYGGSKTQMMAAISHNKTVKAQRELREAIALYAGAFRSMGCTDEMIHVQMVRTYGVNNARALTLRPKDAEALRGRILTDLKELGVMV